MADRKYDVVHKWRDWLQQVYLVIGGKYMGTGLGGLGRWGRGSLWQFSSGASVFLLK